MEVKKIDTSKAEKNFAKLLTKDLTIFLNGAWGSGKTEFIKNVEEIKKNEKKKFVYLDLWNIKDDRTVLNTAFYKLLFIPELFLKLVVIFSLIVSILMTDLVNLGILKKMPFLNQEWLLTIGGIIVLFVSLVQLLKFKSDNFYALGIKYLPLGKKILVIDDFDRVHENKQEESYKLFNILKGKLPVIFLGDYSKISNNEENYLQKIIDRQVELPYILHPRSIWDEYFINLQESMGIKIEDDLKDLFVKENRNIREQLHFNDYVKLEFLEKGKRGHVQENQQLLMIYLYLFHKKTYKLLLEGWFPIYKLEEGTKKRYEYSSYFDNAIFKNEFEKNIFNILGSNSGYPLDYTKNKKNYFIYENINNLSISQAENILANDETLKEHLINKGDFEDDFYSYVKYIYTNEFPIDELSKINIKKNKLERISFELIYKDKFSPLVEYIVNEVYRNYLTLKREDLFNITDEEKYENIMNYFEEKWINNFDLSQKIYFFVELVSFIPFKNIKNRYTNAINATLDNIYIYENQKYKHYLLYILVLKHDGSWIYPENWNARILGLIDKLEDSEFVLFWALYRIIKLDKNIIFTRNLKSVGLVTINREYYNPEKSESRQYSNIISLFEKRLVSIAEDFKWEVK